ncbi:hypothetical protein G3545_02295 [Starkeya sp. ORNL1]|uniref:hypothetical protein n=1 Tax=Starkeya sp. ORNL1 TaxID=2709380 RepID=UPI001463DD6A|nr:hypothetical protein [Starkeya sp. ORNL1]QJP12596.1 hypothetical protein G3545_02295 [Starkeya sp. ORNL1]
MFKTLFKISMLAFESQNVIALRMIKLAQGGAAGTAEAQKMWSEKAEAAMRLGPAFLAGGSIDKMIDDYRVIVRANHSRLGGRRRRR